MKRYALSAALVLSAFSSASQAVDYATDLQAVYMLQNVLEKMDRVIPPKEKVDE